MKKIYTVACALFAILFLAGCSLQDVTEYFSKASQAVVEKDQENSQGFVVTKEFVYEAYDPSIGYIDLSNSGLHGVPDFCALLDKEDYESIYTINLANNSIKVVNQDLSCLKQLKKLNLSYNNIEYVVTLGSLPQLHELLLHKNEIETTKDFPDFPALERLSLAYNQLKEVEGLDKLTTLVKLELQHNQIERIVGVENLAVLEELKLEFNKLSNLDFIDELENLELVTAKGNELRETLLNELDMLNQKFLDKLTVPSGSGSTKSGEVIQ